MSEIQGEEAGKANMLNKCLTVRGMDPRLETSLSWEPRQQSTAGSGAGERAQLV